MLIDKTTALVDNDFVGHVSEINRPQAEVADITKRILSNLGVVAVMHPLVYDNELLKTERTLFLFAESVFHQTSFLEIFQGDKNKEAYYCFLVPELYKKLNGTSYNATGQSVLTCWVRRESLGEIHSMATCLVCGCGIFLSDDGDSKQLSEIIKTQYSDTISVYNREDVVKRIPSESVPRAERRIFSHT